MAEYPFAKSVISVGAQTPLSITPEGTQRYDELVFVAVCAGSTTWTVTGASSIVTFSRSGQSYAVGTAAWNATVSARNTSTSLRSRLTVVAVRGARRLEPQVTGAAVAYRSPVEGLDAGGDDRVLCLMTANTAQSTSGWVVSTATQEILRPQDQRDTATANTITAAFELPMTTTPSPTPANTPLSCVVMVDVRPPTLEFPTFLPARNEGVAHVAFRQSGIHRREGGVPLAHVIRPGDVIYALALHPTTPPGVAYDADGQFHSTSLETTLGGVAASMSAYVVDGAMTPRRVNVSVSTGSLYALAVVRGVPEGTVPMVNVQYYTNGMVFASPAVGAENMGFARGGPVGMTMSTSSRLYTGMGTVANHQLGVDTVQVDMTAPELPFMCYGSDGRPKPVADVYLT